MRLCIYKPLQREVNPDFRRRIGETCWLLSGRASDEGDGAPKHIRFTRDGLRVYTSGHLAPVLTIDV